MQIEDWLGQTLCEIMSEIEWIIEGQKVYNLIFLIQ